jgi:hypothetical protein
VKAKDTHGAESDWTILEVEMPKTKFLNLDFLEKLPILKYFLEKWFL